MYTFGLEENNAFAEAEEFGMRTLHVDPSDTWAVHAMVHVFEMQGRRNEGLRLMREMRVRATGAAYVVGTVHACARRVRADLTLRAGTVLQDDWGSSGMLLCHMQWHWGLFQLDEGDVDMAFSRHDVELRGVRDAHTCPCCAASHDCTMLTHTECNQSHNCAQDDSPFLNNLCDAIGLLWRFELYGCNVEQRWTDILGMQGGDKLVLW